MQFHFRVFIFISFLTAANIHAQENIYSHFFTAASYYNPAFAGDVRYASLQADNRMVLNSGSKTVRNTLLSYDQKIRNHKSGMSFQVNQNKSDFNELKVKANYSFTFSVSKRYLMKSGVGISWNFINSHALDYKYPDQYNQSGYTGLPTGEPSLNERANYPGFAAGVLLYDGLSWFSVSVDDINRPVQDFAGTKTHVPITFSINGSYMIPLDKDKKAKRIFATKGGIEPYSSLGPVFGFYKKGVYNIINLGISGFIRPVYFGVDYRYNSYKSNYLNDGISTLGLLIGYRIESIAISYSYDFRIDKNDVNYRGTHEISLAYYFYTIKKDYIKNRLVPLPNQLMY